MIISRGIRAVTFDMGGTLLEPWPSVGHVYAAGAARHGLYVDPSAINRQFAIAWGACRPFDHSREAWRGIVEASFAGLLPDPVTPRLFADLYHAFARPGAWRVFPDVGPALARLKGAGLKLAVISNWDERLEPLLRDLGLRRWFDAVVISRAAGAPKPDVRIFKTAVSRLGVRPRDILHVGDSMDEDVRGAARAGLRAVWLVRDPRQRLPGGASLANLHSLQPHPK
jgi:putative hydrolase of the HAD superfamily